MDSNSEQSSSVSGFICVVIGAILTTIDIFSSEYYSFLELFALETYLICTAICLLCSSLYHWFCCISDLHNDWLLKLDLSGIALLVTSSLLAYTYYGFYCTPNEQRIHFGFAVVVLLIGLTAPWIDLHYKGENYRPYVYAILVLLGFVPFTHWLLITPVNHRERMIWGFLLMIFWNGLGFTLYITKIPEAYFPYSYVATHIASSHTLWHFCVLGSAYVWFYFIMSYRDLIISEGCAAYRGECEVLNNCLI